MTDPKAAPKTGEDPKGQVTLQPDHLWPWIIGIALAVVLAVNAVFIYIAVSGADSVAPSYNSRDR